MRARSPGQEAPGQSGDVASAGGEQGAARALPPGPPHRELRRAPPPREQPPTDLVAAPDEHVTPVAHSDVAAALGRTGELHGLVSLVGWPWQVVRPQVLVAISHLEAALLFTNVPRTREGRKD